MTDKLDDLRAAVIADPDDDAPRAVLGDALTERNDPRGELYGVQLALGRAKIRNATDLARSSIATSDPAYANLAAMLRRQRDILAAKNLAEASFERGSRIHLDVTHDDDPAARLATMLAREPIVHLTLGGQSLAQMTEISRTPGIARIEELTIDARIAGALDLESLAVLLRVLPKLTSLAILGVPFDSALLFECASLHALTATELGPYHLDDLAVSPHAKTLTSLRIIDPMEGADPLDALDGRFPRLADFDMSVRESVVLRIDPMRQRFLPPSLRLVIHSDPTAAAIAALVERAKFAGVRTLALPSLPRGVDVMVATLAGKARDLVDVTVTGSKLSKAGLAALATFPPLTRLAVSHDGSITELAPAIAALRPKVVALGDAADATAIAQATKFVDDHVRDLTIGAPIAALSSIALVRLDCASAPADLSTLPNLAELVIPR